MKLLKFGKTFIKCLRSKTNTGQRGEKLAQRFLKKQGYKILATNYQNKLGEIDIIAQDKNTLVFVEVKTRTSAHFGLGKEAVDRHKQRQIVKVAQVYLKQHYSGEDVKVRFDVIGIDLEKEKIELIKNAFETA